MVKDVLMDVFKVKCDAIVHQANCFHVMGSGIARVIADLFPEAEAADNLTVPDETKLGTYSQATVKNKKYPFVKTIVNLYSQGSTGSSARFTSYDAMVNGLEKVRDDFRESLGNRKKTLAIPYRIGSNRGGGDWQVVRSIIQSVFGNEPDFDVYVCQNPDLVNEKLVNSAAR